MVVKLLILNMRISTTLKKKNELIEQYDCGESTAPVKNAMKLTESKRHTIHKDAEKIKKMLKLLSQLL